MNENYRLENVVYKCVVSATEKSKEHVYTGVADHYNHTMSSRNQKHKNEIALSTFLPELKISTKETPTLTWSVLKVVRVCPGYSGISKRFLVFEWEPIDRHLPWSKAAIKSEAWT